MRYLASINTVLIVLLMLVIITLFIQWTAYSSTKPEPQVKRREPFIDAVPSTHSSASLISLISFDDTKCQYQADVGLVCPMIKQQKDVIIKPYAETSPNIQAVVREHLKREFQSTLLQDPAAFTDEYIRRNWASSDAFYVMTDLASIDFIGCIAVDRKNFYPYISNLYVSPEYRNQGRATQLLDFAEEYIKYHMGFNTSRLWCDEKLVVFYNKRGYKIETHQESQDGKSIYVMAKVL